MTDDDISFSIVKPENVSSVPSILRKPPIVTSHTPVMSKKKRQARRLNGYQQAKRRKKRLQAAKYTPSRRLAVWRGYIVDGEKCTKYITLSGKSIDKGDKQAWRAQAQDRAYLRSIGVTNKPGKASTINPDRVDPYKIMKESSAPNELRYWGVPELICQAYQSSGISNLHGWQVECLQTPGVLEDNGKSFVYTAPTSGGKSLVAEIMMLRSVLFRARRALLVLPYVSICAEKASQLSEVWSSAGIRVSAFFSDSTSTWHPGVDVAICTIERANSLVNKLIEENCFTEQVGLVVIDEMHILADEHRGYLLELIALKIQLLNNKYQSNVQIVGLSATLPNMNVLADWLGASLYQTNYRPVPLQYFIKSKQQLIKGDGSQSRTLAPGRVGDPDHVAELVLDVVTSNHSVLMFCATKDWCEKAAIHISNFMPRANEKLTTERSKLIEALRQSPGGLCQTLKQTVPCGIAYHHAGLTSQERNIVEQGYRQGTLSCLCATSTLAAGVNLPARRVVLRSLKSGMKPLTAAKLRQMAGRAGRTGFDKTGEAYILCNAGEIEFAQTLINAPLEPLTSALHGLRLAKSLLDSVVLSLIVSTNDVDLFVSSTLRYQEVEQRDAYREEVTEILKHLAQRKFIEMRPIQPEQAETQETQNFPPSNQQSDSQMPQSAPSSGSQKPTESGLPASSSTQPAEPASHNLAGSPLGEAAVFSSFSPMDSLEVFGSLQRAHFKLHLDTDMHLIFLCTPVSLPFEPDWELFLKLYVRLDPRRKQVADAVGVSEHFLQRASMKRPQTSNSRDILDPAKAPDRSVIDKDTIIITHRRFFCAMILHDLLLEVPVHMVARRYCIPRGTIQSLQSTAGTFCGMVVNFCDRLRWWQMAALLGSLHERLGAGVSSELLPLVAIDHVFNSRARLLYDAGFREVEQIAHAAVSTIETLLSRQVAFEAGASQIAQQAVLHKTAKEIIRSAQRLLSSEIQALHDEAEVVGGGGTAAATVIEDDTQSVAQMNTSVASKSGDEKTSDSDISSWIEDADADDAESWFEDDDGQDWKDIDLDDYSDHY